MLIAIGHWLLAPYWYREEFVVLGRANGKWKTTQRLGSNA